MRAKPKKTEDVKSLDERLAESVVSQAVEDVKKKVPAEVNWTQISMKIPTELLAWVDETATAEYTTRSNFIKSIIVKEKKMRMAKEGA